MKKPLPDCVKGVYDDGQYARWVAYTKEKKRSIKDRIEEMINNPVIVASVVYPLGTILSILGIWWLLSWLRSSSKLVETEADIRLSSPYGAGVSRYVRYLEGTEADKEKRLF